MPSMTHRALVPFVACLLLAACLSTACDRSGPARSANQGTPPAGTQNIYIVESGDGIVLNGTLFGAEHGTLVILSHMRQNDQTGWFPFAEELTDHGYAALTLNFRGYGASEGDQDFSKLDEDLAAAVRYMRSLGRQRIFLIGASMGGTAALVVASRESDISGVVAISAPSEFEEQDALAAVPQISAPKLFITSEDDTAAMLALNDLFGAAGEPKESEVYTGNAHGTNLFDSEHADALRERVLAFLEEQGGP